MESPIVVREANASEGDIIADFQIKLAFETEDKKLDRDLLLAGAKAVFEKPRYAKFYMACDGDAVVGMLMVTYEMNASLGGLINWIQSVYVNAEYRKKGVFRKLYNHVVENAKADPLVKCVRLYVETENEVAMKVYSAMGMTNIHEDYKFFERDFVL